MVRIGAEVAFVVIARRLSRLLVSTGQIRARQEVVVFEEPQKHARQNPMHRGLCDVLLTPIEICARGSVRGTRRFPLRFQLPIELRRFVEPLANVLLKSLEELLRLLQQTLTIDHEATAERCSLLIQDSGTFAHCAAEIVGTITPSIAGASGRTMETSSRIVGGLLGRPAAA